MNRERLINYMIEFFPMMHRKFFKELRDNKVHGHDNRILYAIMRDNNKPMKHYCEKLLISKPNFTKASNRLIENGLLKRVTDDKDRRIIKLSITQEGKEVISANRELMVSILDKKLELLDDDDIETLSESFKTIEAIFRKLED